MAAPREAVARGLVTASAGNMAQGVACAARELGVPATIAVPDTAPQAKLAAIERLGGRAVTMPFDDWWGDGEHRFDGHEGLFIHPVEDEGVMAGNGTIGLELLEDLPDVDTVVVPVGGGGLITGIASAVKQLKPGTRVVSAQPETAAAMAARSSRARRPRSTTGRPGSTERARRRSCAACGRISRRSSTTRRSSRSTRSPTRCGCSPSACV